MTDEVYYREGLDFIIEMFKLDMDEFFEVCKFEDMDEYAKTQFPGIKISRKTADRLFEVYSTAKDWEYHGFQALTKEQMERECLLDKSIMDLLKGEPFNKEAVLFAGSRMYMLTAHERPPLQGRFENEEAEQTFAETIAKGITERTDRLLRLAEIIRKRKEEKNKQIFPNSETHSAEDLGISLEPDQEVYRELDEHLEKRIEYWKQQRNDGNMYFK